LKNKYRFKENKHWNTSFYSPLLQSATVKKFMVSYEMLGSYKLDISPEISAKRLREQ